MEFGMILNPYVKVDSEANPYVDKFYPEEGYVLWRDNEEDNLDENGMPIIYHEQYNCLKRFSEEEALHVWAKSVEEVEREKEERE